jgi:hypothetical protein
LRKWWIIWPLYAGLMGFFLGASFFFGLYGRNVTESSIAAQDKQQSSSDEAKSKKEETDEALAYYTLWLMAFTGMLAAATVGLGIATVLLYVTGEKQFRFAVRSSIRQSNSTKESVDLTRRAFIAEHRTWVKVSPTAAEIKIDGGKIRCVVSLIAENVGKSPAQFVSLDLIPYRALGYLAGDQERDALVEQALRFAEARSSGVILMPGEQTEGRFSADAESSLRLEAAVQGQVNARVPADNLTLVVSIAFCVVYKTQASTGWCYTSGVAALSSRERKNFLRDMRDIPADDMKILVLPNSGKMT